MTTCSVSICSLVKIVVVGGWFTLLSVPLHVAAFGVFMAFHLMMILALGPGPGIDFFPPALIKDLVHRTWGAALGLVVSHGISFCTNFLWNGEYRHTTVDAQVAAPWKRLIIMHVTTLASAWSAMLFDAPVGALVMLGVLKIVIDVHGHLRERPMPADAPPRTVPSGGGEGPGCARAVRRLSGLLRPGARPRHDLTGVSGLARHNAVADGGGPRGRLPDARHAGPPRQRRPFGPVPLPLRRRRRRARRHADHAQHDHRRDDRPHAGLCPPASSRDDPADPRQSRGARAHQPRRVRGDDRSAAVRSNAGDGGGIAGVGGLLLLLARRLRAPG